VDLPDWKGAADASDPDQLAKLLQYHRFRLGHPHRAAFCGNHLFIGIHNAWDLVTYLAVERAHPENRDRD